MNSVVIAHTTFSTPLNQKLPGAVTFYTCQGRISLALGQITSKPEEWCWGKDSVLWQAGFLALSTFQIFFF